MRHFNRSRTTAALAVLSTILCAGGTRQALGQTSAPSLTIRQLTQPAVIDGRLDDAAWRDATPFTGFTQREPHVGEAASERTEVRVFSDREALYVGAWLYDSHADALVAGEKVRDGQLTNSDYFSFILDTYRDRQNGFVFGTTPAAIEYDGQVSHEGEGGGVFQQGQTRAQAGAIGGFNLNWDGSWTVATSRDSLGWYAEFRIPFTTLRYGGGATQTWGVNFSRLVRRTNEEVFWAPIPRQFNLYRLSLAGTMAGIQPPPNRIATVTPYVIGSVQRSGAPAATTHDQDFGADAKYGLTPSLTLDLTYNTDFAQVEVDDQRVNLTRFPLFFPEKRPFFLENAGIFSAGTPQAVDLFFTRRIGIDSLGTPIPILGGGRVTGRIGGTTVGALQMLTDDVPTQAGQSYSVARLSREIGRRSRVGVIALQRLARTDASDYHRTYGVDGRIGLGDDWTSDWWGAATQAPGRGADDLAGSVRIGYATEKWNNNIRFLHVGNDFVPELGFLSRSPGFRNIEVGVMRFVRDTSRHWLRDWNPHVTFRGYYGTDGYFQSGWMHIDVAKVDLANGGRVGPEYDIYHEGLQAPFEISPGIFLPPGAYDYPEIGFEWTGDPSLPLSWSLRSDVGQFYNGNRSSHTVTITGRRGTTISTSLLVDHSDVHLAQGDFTRSLVGLRLAYFFTPRISIQTLTQFNDQAHIWTANTRFSWLNTAGTGLFIVFNDAEDADSFFSWKRPQTHALTIKFSRQFGTGG